MDTRVKNIVATLDQTFPNPKPFLNFRTPFELLVATILAAQCTDERVNKVTPALFRAANTPEKILKLGQKKLILFVRSTGFFRAKSRNILGASKMLVEKFASRVPSTLEELQKLPGVGRKTASCVLAQGMDIPAFPVDRHVFRVANRLALAHAKDADKTSEELQKNLPKNLWIPMHLQLVMLGRTWCRPNPKCPACPLLPYCPEGKKRTRKNS